MMFKSKLTISLGAIILAGSSMAAQDITCPKIATIKAQGISEYRYLFGMLYQASHTSHYNTDSQWTFTMTPIVSKSKDRVLELAKKRLSKITSEAQPLEDGDGITCIYERNLDEPFMAVASKQKSGAPLKTWF